MHYVPICKTCTSCMILSKSINVCGQANFHSFHFVPRFFYDKPIPSKFLLPFCFFNFYLEQIPSPFQNIVSAIMFTTGIPILPRPSSSVLGREDKDIPMDLQSFDVLCDDLEHVHHVGNRRIMITIAMYCQKYADAKTISEQRSVAACVVDTVMSSYRPGGRFLRTDRNNNWVSVDRRQAIKWTQRSFERILPEIKGGRSYGEGLSATKDKQIDTRVAKILLRQNEIFTTLSENSKKQKQQNQTEKKITKSTG